MGLIISWLVLSAGIWLIAQLLSDFEVKGIGGALLTGAIFGVLHWAIGKLLFFVIGLGTLGIGFLLAFLTRWIVTAIVLKITDSVLDSLTIRNFKTAFIAAILLSLLSTASEWVRGGAEQRGERHPLLSSVGALSEPEHGSPVYGTKVNARASASRACSCMRARCERPRKLSA